MKKSVIIFMISMIILQVPILAQESLKLDVKPGKKEAIYFNLTEDNKLQYFLNENAADSKKDVDSKSNAMNVYFEWFNPLRYKLTWKDSIYTDERDKAITDFINLLVPQFGTAVTGLNTVDIEEKAAFVDKNQQDSTEIRTFLFHNPELLSLTMHLRDNKANLNIKDGEIYQLNKLLETVKGLDSLVAINVSEKAVKIYSALFDYTSINEYNNDFTTQKSNLKELGATIEKVDDARKKMADQLKEFNVKDEGLNRYIKAVLSSYLHESLNKLNEDRKIADKLKSVIDLVENSAKGKSEVQEGYFKVRNIDFEDGKRLETRLLVTEYEFDSKGHEYKKKGDVLEKSFSFQRHSVLSVFASGGVFYGNTTLKGYGISNDEAGEFIITEDDISRNTAVTALFLNFSYEIGPYFAPLLQIGADPTKERPFLLLGTGIALPSASFAISGGPIWTWNQKLDQLSVGQTISSTTELEKDLSYHFDVEPKGWYLGIQYNF